MAIPDGIELMWRIEWITAQVHVSHVAHFGHLISSGIHPPSGAGKTYIGGGVAAEMGIKGAAVDRPRASLVMADARLDRFVLSRALSLRFQPL